MAKQMIIIQKDDAGDEIERVKMFVRRIIRKSSYWQGIVKFNGMSQYVYSVDKANWNLDLF